MCVFVRTPLYKCTQTGKRSEFLKHFIYEGKPTVLWLIVISAFFSSVLRPSKDWLLNGKKKEKKSTCVVTYSLHCQLVEEDIKIFAVYTL